MAKFKLTTKGDYFKVYIDGLLHLALKKDEVKGVQTWATDGDINPFKIEFYSHFGEVLIEYDTLDKWKRMLKLVDKMFESL
jgi:hypothetical protein